MIQNCVYIYVFYCDCAVVVAPPYILTCTGTRDSVFYLYTITKFHRKFLARFMRPNRLPSLAKSAAEAEDSSVAAVLVVEGLLLSNCICSDVSLVPFPVD